MAKPILLATFVHISDLHIGMIDAGSGDAIISTALHVGLDNFKKFDGLLGHSGLALQDLSAFIEDLRGTDERFHILVTGDVSRYGDSSELTLAQRFLDQEVDLAPPAGDYVGLSAAGRVRTIPGNHDHWAGTAGPVGAKPSGFYARFIGDLPNISRHRLGNHGHFLSLLEVDSDADVTPNSVQRIYARGNFSSQLSKLDTQLRPRQASEVRIMLIHHSRTWTGFELGMADKAKRDLDDFLLRQEVSVILCGHTHRPTVRRHYAGARECWECGAGSATQMDTVPLKWRLKLRDPDRIKPHPNSLLLHRIYDLNGRLEWMATTYIRSQAGFQPVHPSRWFTLI